ncbi:MAG: autotransporter adhesin family protein, partial [Coriobacteriia bacterium]|nr:autotransporter adhesin family protein [Coriobacteriia bacterium]
MRELKPFKERKSIIYLSALILTVSVMLLTLPNVIAFADDTYDWADATVPIIADGDTVAISGSPAGTLQIPAGATVTITGSVTTADQGITLDIGEWATVDWQATYSGSPAAGDGLYLVTLEGSGSFIASSGAITNSGDGGSLLINATSTTVTLSGSATVSSPSIGIAININVDGVTLNVESGASVASTGTGYSACVLVGDDIHDTSINVNGGTVSSTSASIAIRDGFTSATCSNNTAITVNGGAVSAVGNSAITTFGSASTVTVNGGDVYAPAQTSNYPVIIVNGNVGDGIFITGGEVYASATSSGGIFGSNGGVLVTVGNISISGGYLHCNYGGTILTMGDNCTVTISGGTIEARNNSLALYAPASYPNTQVVMTGGTVLTQTSSAFWLAGSDSSITINGGLVFSYGTSLFGTYNAIYLPGSNEPDISGTAVVVAWAQQSGASYAAGTMERLIALPGSAAVRWNSISGIDGIEYQNGSNTGLLPLDVTILAEPDLGLIFDASEDPLTGGCFWLDADANGQIDAGELRYVPAFGTAVWSDPNSDGPGILRLDGLEWQTSAPVALKFVGGTLTLALATDSNNQIVSTYNGTADSAGIVSEGYYLTISGIGTLTAIGGDTSSGSSYGIMVEDGQITVVTSELVASGGKADNGISAGLSAEIVAVYAADVTASGGEAMFSYGAIGDQVGITDGSLRAYAASSFHTSSIGIRVFSRLNFNAGTIESIGSTMAFSTGDSGIVLMNSDAYNWLTNSLPAAPGGSATLYYPGSGAAAYDYTATGDTDLYVWLESERVAVVDDVTVSGYTGFNLTSGQSATITLYGDRFAATDPAIDASSWFSAGNLPAGVTAVASVEEGDTTAEVAFSGAPTAVSSAAFQLTVPGDRLGYGTDIVVFANADARFDIRAGLVFDDDQAYDIPASEVGVVIDPVDVSGGVTGGVQPYRFTASGLPAGLAIDELTGVVSGTPTTATAAGSATVTVTDSLDFARSITIDYGAVTNPGQPPDDPITTPLAFTHSAAFDIPASRVGQAIAPVALASGVTGGVTPYRFSATGLPAGLTINELTGVISGTPTAATAAGSAVITVTDSE